MTEIKHKSQAMPYSLTLLNCDARHVSARVCLMGSLLLKLLSDEYSYPRARWTIAVRPGQINHPVHVFSLKRKEEKDVERKIWVCPKKAKRLGENDEAQENGRFYRRQLH